MDQKNIALLFSDFEKLPQTWDIKLNGLPVWPLVRILAYFQWRNKVGSGKKYFEKNLVFAKKNNFELLDIDNKGSPLILMPQRPDGYTEVVSGKWFDRFLDSIFISQYEHFRLEKITSSLETNEAIKSTFIDPKPFFIASRSTMKRSILNEERFLKSCLTNLNEALGSKISFSGVIEFGINVFAWRLFWSAVLLARRPNLIVLTCFYSPSMLGCCLAARDNNIPVVDIQHGQQGKNHPMMANWDLRHLTGDFNFPTQFAFWETEMHKNFEKSWQTDRLEGVFFGNPWLSVRAQGIVHCQQRDSNPQGNNVLEKGNILVALQPIAPLVPDFVIQFLTELSSQTSHRIVIRPHPHQMENTLEIDQRFAHLENSIVRGSTDLFEELDSALVVLTAYSSVSWEAKQLGVPTIFFDKLGRDYFFDETPDYFLALSLEELNEFWGVIEARNSSKKPLQSTDNIPNQTKILQSLISE